MFSLLYVFLVAPRSYHLSTPQSGFQGICTDCYVIRFILSYDGANHAILCLQMRLMCWDVNIVHQNVHYITDADYWVCLGANLCIDPLFKTYLDLNWSLRLKCPAPSSFPMKPKNMLNYRGPRIMPPTDTDDTSDAAHCQAIVSTVMIDNVHSSSASTVNPLLLKRPPLVPPRSLREFLWEPLHQPKHDISLTCNNADIEKQENPLLASSPASPQDNPLASSFNTSFIDRILTAQSLLGWR